jgi:hypothetical protein
MSDYGDGISGRRIATYTIGMLILFAVGMRWFNHRDAPEPNAEKAPLAAPPASATPNLKAAGRAPAGMLEILANCHPHLREVSTIVPNITVDERYNIAGVQLKVRFWVNAYGFVTRAFTTGASVVSLADQDAELDYLKILTFDVPNTDDCRTKEIEMFGTFAETREPGGEWATVLDIHPRYAMQGDRVVESR